MSWMQDLPRYTLTYCQYGEKRMKPTDIWTNHPDPKFLPPCKNGDPCHDAAPRGSMTGTQALKNWQERSRIPEKLCKHIIDICEELFPVKRICDCCGSEMTSGYCIYEGLEYYCSDDCLYSAYTLEEYEQLCEEDCGYWTEWDEEIEV